MIARSLERRGGFRVAWLENVVNAKRLKIAQPVPVGEMGTAASTPIILYV